MMDMSPTKILNSSGSSSRLVDLKNFPYLFSLLSSGSKFPVVSFSLDIVRNFISLKMRSSPFFFFFPGLFWTKNGLPFMKIKPKRIKTKNKGDRTIIASPDKTTSQNLLKNGL